MSWGMATGLRAARQQVVVDAVDAGPAAGQVKILSGVQPVTGGAETTVLVVIPFNDPCAVVSGPDLIWDIDPVPEGTAIAAGDATWARVEDSAGNFVMDGPVGTNVIIDNTNIQPGQKVRLIGGVITEGNAGVV